jgi:hypothetical protein
MGGELTPRRQRLEVAGAWLVKVGGSATPGELGAALDINRQRRADVLTDLAAAGYVTRGGGRVQLTPEGWSRFSGLGPGMAGDVLDRVLAGWPARHRAFIELLVCSIIARHHLAAAYPWHEHLGFMAIGETKTFKTAMADLVCYLFGFDRVQTRVHTPGETAGSLLGRFGQKSEGLGYVWEPAPMTLLPFVLLDEFDKAKPALQDRAWNYFRGTVATPVEGVAHQLLPTPMLAANPPAKGDRLGALRTEYRRRSVVLDTGNMAGRGRELVKHLRGFYANPTPADRLSLAGLVPPAALDQRALAVFEAAYEVLTEAGRAEWPEERALELATLGRLALLGPGADHMTAAAATAVAYLTVAESVPGQVLDTGWQAVVAEWAGQVAGGESLTAALQRSSKAKAEALGQATTNRRRTQHAEQGVLKAGAELAERCRLARDVDLNGHKVPREHKPAAAGLRKALARHLASAATVRTAAGLDDVTALATPVLEEAGQLSATIKAMRDQDEAARGDILLDRQRERAEVKQRGIWETQQRRQARANEIAQLSQVRALARHLEGLCRRKAVKAGESPLAVLADLRVDGRALLTYQPPAAEAPPQGFINRLTYQKPRGRWVIAGTSYGWPGMTWDCPALANWGPNTQAVLTPMLTLLHQVEDVLVQKLGRKPRQRPRLPSSQTRAIAR